jgi:Ser/Thr protein kinase RdoA (MazF antagonist)
MSEFPDGPEIALPSGDVTEGVVRIGDTVRRPHQPTSAAVAAYLQHLESVGFAGAPRYLGRDRRGRDVLTFVAGEVPGDPPEAWAAADEVLPGVGRLVRALHDASEGWTPQLDFAGPAAGRPRAPLPAGEPRLVAHRDVTPQNVVFRDGTAYALVDFDLVNWTTRSVDVANTAMHWIPLSDPVDRPPVYAGADVGRRLRLLLDGYGRDVLSAAAVLHACALRFAGLYDSMRWNAEHLGGGWARMWREGAGDTIRRRAEWFVRSRDDIAAAADR